MAFRVVRVYHGGRDAAHRLRERALVAAGAEITLVVPQDWPEGGAQRHLPDEPFPIMELATKRAGDVNRHAYASPAALRAVLDRVRPDLLDLHEEPFSVATRQWLTAADDLPAVAYTAQNVDKRFPPPFAQYEATALKKLRGLYPCSRQAASVARGKGFQGPISVLPLGRDDLDEPGDQAATDPEITLGLVGRLVSEKGVLDAVRVLANLRQTRAARLVLVGSGPEEGAARTLAGELGVADALELLEWQDGPSMVALYRQMHVVLVPSRATQTWTEQFGRVIVEAQAAGAVVAGYASGSIPEVMGDAGVLVPEGDDAALAHAVRALLDEPARFASLRAAGLARSETTTWDAVAQRQLALYEQVLRGNTPPVAAGRDAAVAEFGAPATLRGGAARPFALPVLRKDAAVTRALGTMIDTVTRSG